ncbi:MAG: hypothetical protein ACREVE_13190 [Gammaproteobacteria bacterium]
MFSEVARHYRFRDQRPDGYDPCGCDRGMLQLTVAGEIPEIKWPLSPDVVPPMRRKTLEPSRNKHIQADALVDRATAPTVPKPRAVLGAEVEAPTAIDNAFR